MHKIPRRQLLIEENSLSSLEEGRKWWKSVTSFARKDATPTANQLLSGLPSINGPKKRKKNRNFRRMQNEPLRKMKDGSGERQRSQGKREVEGQEAKMCLK